MKVIDGRKIIWETNNFTVVVPHRPFISREEGGHIIIMGRGDKYRFDSRTDLTPSEVLEVQRLCQMICCAYKSAMKEHGVDIIRLNYFEAGNWSFKPGSNDLKAYYHEHILGRTIDAKKQVFPEAPYLPSRDTGFYDDFKQITDEDIELIIEKMRELETDEKYSIDKWTIKWGD